MSDVGNAFGLTLSEAKSKDSGIVRRLLMYSHWENADSWIAGQLLPGDQQSPHEFH